MKNSTARRGAVSARQIHMDGKGGTRCRQRHEEACHDQQIDESRPTRNNQDDCADQRDASDNHPYYARDAPPAQAVPGGHAGDQHTAQQNQATGNWFIATAIASASVATATTSAKIAISRRLIAVGLRQQP